MLTGAICQMEPQPTAWARKNISSTEEQKVTYHNTIAESNGRNQTSRRMLYKRAGWKKLRCQSSPCNTGTDRNGIMHWTSPRAHTPLGGDNFCHLRPFTLLNWQILSTSHQDQLDNNLGWAQGRRDHNHNKLHDSTSHQPSLSK